MLCAISGEAPQDPVVSKKTGIVYERRLVEKYIDEHGKEPATDHELDREDLLPVKSARIVRPRPPTLTSIPALLATFQNEWDALALETHALQEQLARTREELATALYQHDAAVRVILRLTKERDEARDSLSRLAVTAGGDANGSGDAMAVDAEGLPQELAATVDETHQRLSKSRRKRPIPDGWATSEEVAAFHTVYSDAIPVAQISSIGLQGDYAAIAGLQGEVGIFSAEALRLERSLRVDEPVTDALWTDTKLVLATSKGSVKVLDSGNEVASFSEHAGPATGVALHPSGRILASVGTDKSFVLYDVTTLKRVSRVFTNTALTTSAFHPDGHFLAAGTVSGEIRLYMTATGEQATSFSLGAPIQAIAFSENGYFIAAVAKGQTTVTIFDLRKEGAAAAVKTLDIGSAVSSLAWDFTGQFLATGGPAGITVQQYSKGSKGWSQLVSAAVPSNCVRWGSEGKKLISANNDGVLSVLGLKEEKE